MSRHRWMKFWPADWRADPALRSCSPAARGLWIDLITLMHEAEPYGHLLIGGVAPSAKRLASVLSMREKEIVSLLNDLRSAGVLSETDDGTIYSRRMVRDAESLDLARSHGSRGGNPSLKRDKGGVNPPLNQPLKLEAEAEAEAEKEPPLSPPEGGEPLVDLLGDPIGEGGAAKEDPDQPLWDVLGEWNQNKHERAKSVREIGDKVRRSYTGRLLARAGSLAMVGRYFDWIARQPSLTGDGRNSDFVAFYDWCIRPPNVTRLSEEAGLEFGPDKPPPARRRGGA